MMLALLALLTAQAEEPAAQAEEPTRETYLISTSLGFGVNHVLMGSSVVVRFTDRYAVMASIGMWRDWRGALVGRIYPLQNARAPFIQAGVCPLDWFDRHGPCVNLGAEKNTGIFHISLTTGAGFYKTSSDVIIGDFQADLAVGLSFGPPGGYQELDDTE